MTPKTVKEIVTEIGKDAAEYRAAKARVQAKALDNWLVTPQKGMEDNCYVGSGCTVTTLRTFVEALIAKVATLESDLTFLLGEMGTVSPLLKTPVTPKTDGTVTRFSVEAEVQTSMRMGNLLPDATCEHDWGPIVNVWGMPKKQCQVCKGVRYL